VKNVELTIKDVEGPLGNVSPENLKRYMKSEIMKILKSIKEREVRKMKYNIGQRVFSSTWEKSGRVILLDKEDVEQYYIRLGDEESFRTAWFREEELEPFNGLDVEVIVRGRSMFIHCHGGSKYIPEKGTEDYCEFVRLYGSKKHTQLYLNGEIWSLQLKDGVSYHRCLEDYTDIEHLRGQILGAICIFNEQLLIEKEYPKQESEARKFLNILMERSNLSTASGQQVVYKVLKYMLEEKLKEEEKP